LKILLVNHTFRETDGQGRVNLRIAQHLASRGYQLTLVGQELPESLRRLTNVNWLDVRPLSLPTTAARHFTFAVKVHRLIRRLRPSHDLVILNGGMSFPAADINLCHFVHSSWIRSPHHPLRTRKLLVGLYQYCYSLLNSSWETNAYRRSRLVVAVSDLVRRQLIDDCRTNASNVRVIHNGLDALPPLASEHSVSDQRHHLRGELGLSPVHFVVFFAGELKTPRKNFDVLLRAVRRLPDDVRVVAAGGTDGGPYPAMAREMGVIDRVHFLGHRNDVRLLYTIADCFAFLSHYDPFALVVTEAMAAGLPVITSKTVGASEVVLDAACGVVLDDPEDDRRLADEIIKLKNDTPSRDRLAANARVYGPNLAWDHVGSRYENVIAELAGGRGLQ
jgi:glycosyltransferase involved in cell wall biosynthesis